RVRTGSLVVVRSEHAAQRCSDTEHRKIRTRNQFAVDTLSFAFRAHVHGCTPAAEHSAEDLVVVAEVFVHRIRELVSTIIAAVMRSTTPKENKLLRILHGKQSEQNLVHQ